MKKKQYPILPAALCLVAFSILFGSIIVARSIPEHEKPEILILRESTDRNWNGDKIILLDYKVGGITTNETFYPYEMDLYYETISHLKRSGRLRYASPMIEPMGGQ